MSLNLANKITIFRLLLIPVFAAFILNYKFSGGEKEWLRYTALLVFLIASISDAVDGFVARTFNQKTHLGSILDPLADKLLLVTAIILLSLKIPNMTYLPLWFPILVISRDIFLLMGSAIVYVISGDLKVVPNLLGKATTFFQMTTVLWVLFVFPNPQWVWTIAGVLTFLSGLVYIVRGSKQLTEAQS